MVEDLISTGGSSYEAIIAAREAGLKVDHCVAIFSYELQKSIDTFKDCKLTTLSNLSELLKEAVSSEYISEDEKNIVEKWQKDPEGWL